MCLQVQCKFRSEARVYITPVVVVGLCLYTAMFVVSMFQWRCVRPNIPGIPAEWLEFMTPYSYEKFATVAPFYLEDRFECGWPIENTIYRTSLLLVALINSALSLIAHLADANLKCFRSFTKWTFFILTPFLTAAFILDADKVRNSVKFCSKVLETYDSMECAPIYKYGSLVFGVFLCTGFCMASFTVLYMSDKQRWRYPNEERFHRYQSRGKVSAKKSSHHRRAEGHAGHKEHYRVTVA